MHSVDDKAKYGNIDKKEEHTFPSSEIIDCLKPENRHGENALASFPLQKNQW